MEREKAVKLLKRAFIDTIPVMTGYLVLGMGFGIVLRTKGFGILWCLAMSVFIYAGSMQYVAIDLISGGASLITAALTTLMVNARHLFYGLSMVERYRGAGRKKPYLMFALTDETYSLVCREQNDLSGEDDHRYCFAVSLLDQLYWVAGSVLGSAIGTLITFNTNGIDFALTALFVTVFVEQWLSSKDHLPAITGVAVTVLCRIIFGRANFLIPSMIGITVILTAVRHLRKGGAKHE